MQLLRFLVDQWTGDRGRLGIGIHRYESASGPVHVSMANTFLGGRLLNLALEVNISLNPSAMTD